MTNLNDLKVNNPDPRKAEELATQAIAQAQAANYTAAISLIEEAIRLDSLGALNGFHGIRAELYAAIGKEGPWSALNAYDDAIQLAASGRYRDAKQAYGEASALDPDFLWPLNNLAWMLSTSRVPATRDGETAVKCATEACQRSNWNCWAFLGTLAAAYAEAGDFERAIRCQEVSLLLTPADHVVYAELILRHFRAGERFIDWGIPVAAGGSAASETTDPYCDPIARIVSKQEASNDK